MEENKLCLKVENLTDLEEGIVFYHSFDWRGGSIGSHIDNDWVLQDRDYSIEDCHAYISFEEDIFGISPANNSCEIFLNDSFSKLNPSYDVSIKIGDSLKMGNLTLTVIHEEDLENNTILQEQEALDKRVQLDEIREYDKLDNFDPLSQGDFKIEENEASLFQTNDLGLDLPPENPIPKSPVLESPISGGPALDNPNSSFDHYFTAPDQFTPPHPINGTCFTEILQILQKEVATYESRAHKRDQFFIHKDIETSEMLKKVEYYDLLKSRSLLNALILLLLTEELYNPMLEKIDNQIFSNCIGSIIEQVSEGDYATIEEIVINKIKKYLQATEDINKKFQ